MRKHFAPFVIVFAGVELSVAAFYGLYEPERIRFEVILAGVITLVVGFPTIWYFQIQHQKLVRMSRELKILSATDQMTGLLNRQSFLARLGASLEERAWGDSAGAFAYLDADQFKSINDRFGHDTGDRVILAIAESMKAAIRSDDLMARLGGEEFAIFLPNATFAQAAGAAERLRAELRIRNEELAVDGLTITVSIGIASHKPGTSALELMKEADECLYVAKHSGRNAVVINQRRFEAA